MNLKELETRLDEIVDDYASEVKANVHNIDGPVTKGDIEELGRQTFYALNSFKREFIAYLKEK